MVSLSLMARLTEAVRREARLILVGDPGQLTSIEAGAVLGDIVGPAAEGPRMSAAIRAAVEEATGPPVDGTAPSAGSASRHTRPPTCRSATASSCSAPSTASAAGSSGSRTPSTRATPTPPSARSADDSITWVDADAGDPAALDRLSAVRDGAVTTGLAVIEAARDGDAARAIRELGAFRVLCAHRRGAHGVATWMPRIETWLAGELPGFGADQWYVGRPLLVTENDHGIRLYNGDTGVVVTSATTGRPTAAFERQGEIVTFSPTRLAAVETVYAMTVHKSQGSQFDTAAVLLPDPASPILTRELLYTAVTRARSHLILVGDRGGRSAPPSTARSPARPGCGGGCGVDQPRAPIKREFRPANARRRRRDPPPPATPRSPRLRTAAAGRRMRRRRSRTRPSRARARRSRRSTSARPSSTRLPATVRASPAATPAIAARAPRPRPRPSRSAAAAKNAADHDEWPLGNDGPSVSAIGFSAGRTRSARFLIVVVRIPFPATTTRRNGTTHRLLVLTVSTSASAAASAATTIGSPRFVIAFSTSVETGDACPWPQFATLLSTRRRSGSARTRYASVPSTTPPTTITTSASVRASPVAAAGSSLAASVAPWPERRRIAAPASRAVPTVDGTAPARCQQSAATIAATAVAARTNKTIVTGTSPVGSRSLLGRYPVDPGGTPVEARARFSERRRGARNRWAVPLLDARLGGPAERFAVRLRGHHPAAVFFAAILAGLAVLFLIGIALGLLVTDVLLHAGGLARTDESVVGTLVAERTPFLTDASEVGSALGGAPFLPILVGTIALVCALLRKWRIAAFAVFALGGGVGDLPRHVARGPARAAGRRRGSTTFRPTTPSRPVTPRRPSPSTSGSRCSSRHGSATAACDSSRGPSRSWSRCSSPSPGCTAACTTRSTSPAAS